MTYLLRQATPTTPFRLLMALVAALLFSLAGGSAGSQTNRTIKIVVAVPPGGNTDIVARVLADQIGRAHGPAMVIENRPGAGSAIATKAGARAPSEGNTLPDRRELVCGQPPSREGKPRPIGELRADLLP